MLLIGVASAALFVIIVFVEGALRPGYDAMYHTVSELCLGERAWVQVTNFAQMGVGMVILAAGVNQALDSSIASILLGLFGLGLVGAAIFRPDPMRGYPPDAPRVVASEQSRHAKIHDVLGGPIFLALFLAVLLVAFDLEGGWRAYTFATAGVGLALTITTAISLQRDAPRTGLANRGVVLVYWSWIVLIGIHLSGTTPS